MIAFLTDRTHTVAAAEAVQPRGTLATPAVAATRFSKERAETISYVRATQEDLRGHGTSGSVEFGHVDAYQYLLIMAAHTARHTAQIAEVKSTVGYPK